jgi:hypothetical protein
MRKFKRAKLSAPKRREEDSTSASPLIPRLPPSLGKDQLFAGTRTQIVLRLTDLVKAIGDFAANS